MKKIWVVSLKTSLPNEEMTEAESETTVRAFDSFKGARRGAREFLKEIAFGKENAMFDGKGTLKAFAKYAETAWDPTEEEEADDNPKHAMEATIELIRTICSGKDAAIPDEYTDRFNALNHVLKNVMLDLKTGVDEYTVTDWLIAIIFAPDGFRVCGVDDGPCNGYDPDIDTDMLSMTEEKNYHLYIKDLFGQNFPSELYLDLIQTELEEA